MNWTSGVYLMRFERRISISPDGTLRSAVSHSRSYGPKDGDPNRERWEIRQGRLSSEQVTDLLTIFEGWEALSDESGGAVPDGPELSIRYGDRTLSGGPHDEQIETITRLILKLAELQPIIAPSASKPSF